MAGYSVREAENKNCWSFSLGEIALRACVCVCVLVCVWERLLLGHAVCFTSKPLSSAGIEEEILFCCGSSQARQEVSLKTIYYDLFCNNIATTNLLWIIVKFCFIICSLFWFYKDLLNKSEKSFFVVWSFQDFTNRIQESWTVELYFVPHSLSFVLF